VLEVALSACELPAYPTMRLAGQCDRTSVWY
jgi:hypothetical protein